MKRALIPVAAGISALIGDTAAHPLHNRLAASVQARPFSGKRRVCLIVISTIMLVYR